MEGWPPPAAIATFADGDPAENGWVSDAPPVEAIEIAAYSPEWPVLFEASKELIVRALPGVALKIEHVGSTAVPNLAAKPIIDMDLIVVLDQTVCPVRERSCWDAKGGLVCEPDASPTSQSVLPWKEGEDCPGMSDVIAIVQVIDPRIIKVDSLLDESHSQCARVEGKIAISRFRDCRHVMDAWHGSVTFQ
jgi:hypothetical protein